METRLQICLRSARAARGLTLRDVEDLSDKMISNAYLSQLENGKNKNPQPKAIRTLARILKLDYLELMILAGHLTVKDLKGKV